MQAYTEQRYPWTVFVRALFVKWHFESDGKMGYALYHFFTCVPAEIWRWSWRFLLVVVDQTENELAKYYLLLSWFVAVAYVWSAVGCKCKRVILDLEYGSSRGFGLPKNPVFSQVSTKKGLKTPIKLPAALKGPAVRPKNEKMEFSRKNGSIFLCVFFKNERYTLYSFRADLKYGAAPCISFGGRTSFGLVYLWGKGRGLSPNNN